MIIPCLRLIMKQKARLPMLSITMQSAVVPGNRLHLLFYYYTAKTARGMKITHKAFKCRETLKTTKVGIQ